ncbi:hypothetical protein FHS42_001168 [Streptomyces zagrosensis]|uniref:Uncharacterized protein n=1 Tax=Streptomyces zagrosensis TaxID=1042984 RepID=A0A7W9UX18_9ACTN|nr:hypothetical protein [Streptomyces zagrosensis]
MRQLISVCCFVVSRRRSGRSSAPLDRWSGGALDSYPDGHSVRTSVGKGLSKDWPEQSDVLS